MTARRPLSDRCTSWDWPRPVPWGRLYRTLPPPRGGAYKQGRRVGLELAACDRLIPVVGALSCAQPSAALTRAGVNGNTRSRTPVALKNALAMAPDIAPIVGSPAPHATSVGWS